MQGGSLFAWNYEAAQKVIGSASPDNGLEQAHADPAKHIAQPPASEGVPIIVNQGGTSSGKTYGILQALFVLAGQLPRIVVSVVGQDVPNLKRGAIRDARNIVAENPEIVALLNGAFKEQDKYFQFKNGSILEFVSYETEQDAKSGKRDILFVNEANGIAYEIFYQLHLRTRLIAFIDYNPTARFWAHDEVIGKSPNVFFRSNYLDNPFLTAATIANIEKMHPSKGGEENLWRVYGEGRTGQVKGIIFPNCKRVAAMPNDLKRAAYGLDFGFSNDPTALVLMGESGGELWGEELLYQTGLTTPELFRAIKPIIKAGIPIFADAAEPKTIKQLRLYGLNVHAAPKGADSVRNGIDLIKGFGVLNITNDSDNWWKEQTRYVWSDKRKDTQGRPLPIVFFNHLWDAARYARAGVSQAKAKQGWKAA